MNITQIECPVPGAKAYSGSKGINIIQSDDNTPKWGKLKHVSISKQFEYPSWSEILEAKEHFFGDIDVMMIIPKKENYVNVHNNCFHLWQTPESWDVM